MRRYEFRGVECDAERIITKSFKAFMIDCERFETSKIFVKSESDKGLADAVFRQYGILEKPVVVNSDYAKENLLSSIVPLAITDIDNIYSCLGTYLYDKETVYQASKFVAENTGKLIQLIEKIKEAVNYPSDLDSLRSIFKNDEYTDILDRFMAFTDCGNLETIQKLSEYTDIDFDEEFKKHPENCSFKRINTKELCDMVYTLSTFADQLYQHTNLEFSTYCFEDYTRYKDIDDALVFEKRNSSNSLTGIDLVCVLDKQKYSFFVSPCADKDLFAEKEDLEEVSGYEI